MGHGHETPSVAPRASTEASSGTSAASEPSFTQPAGNAARLEQLGLAARPDEPASSAEVEEATKGLEEAVRELWDARVDGIDRAWERAEIDDPPHWTESLLVPVVAAGLAAASEVLTAGIIATAVAGLSGASQAIANDVLRSLQTELFSGTAESTVSSTLRDQRSNEAPSLDAFFVGCKAGARVQGLADQAVYRRLAAELARAGSGTVDAIRRVEQVVTARIATAEATQIERALSG